MDHHDHGLLNPVEEVHDGCPLLVVEQRQCHAEDDGEEDDLKHVAARERLEGVRRDDVEDVVDGARRVRRVLCSARRVTRELSLQ